MMLVMRQEKWVQPMNDGRERSPKGRIKMCKVPEVGRSLVVQGARRRAMQQKDKKMRLLREAQAKPFRASGKGNNGKGSQRQVLNATLKSWYLIFDMQDMQVSCKPRQGPEYDTSEIKNKSKQKSKCLVRWVWGDLKYSEEEQNAQPNGQPRKSGPLPTLDIFINLGTSQNNKLSFISLLQSST